MRRHSTRLSQAHDDPDEGDDGLTRTADRDYPEFGTILDDRPDPGGVITVIGARRTANAYGTDEDDRDGQFNGEPGDTGVYWSEPGQQQWTQQNEPQEPAPPPPWAMSPMMARLAELEEAQGLFGMSHHATDINGTHVDDHGDAPQHGTVPRAQNPDSYDGRSTEGDGDPRWSAASDEEKRENNGAAIGMYPEGISAGGGPGISVGPFVARVPWTPKERGNLHTWQENPPGATWGDFVPSSEFPFLRPGESQHGPDDEADLRAEGAWEPYEDRAYDPGGEDEHEGPPNLEDAGEYRPGDWTDVADSTDHSEDVGGWVHHTLSSLREAASDAEDRYWQSHLSEQHGWSAGQFERARMRGENLSDMHAAGHSAGLARHPPHAISSEQRIRSQRDLEREETLGNMFGPDISSAPGKDKPEGYGLAHPARGGYAGGDPAGVVERSREMPRPTSAEQWEERDPARFRRWMSSLTVHAHDDPGDSLDDDAVRTGLDTGLPQASDWSGEDGSLDDGPDPGDGSGIDEHPEQWPAAGAAVNETSRAMTQGRYDGKARRGGGEHLAAFVAASGSPAFRFEFTAAWQDVLAKAKRIRAEGHVRITHASAGMVIGEVRGDHDTYETGIQRPVGHSQSIQHWACGCPWASFNQDKAYSARYAARAASRYAGRPCSHVMALQFEAQSRGMFGRQVSSDEGLPSWSPSTVVVKSMPPWEGEPHAGRWREEWRAPVASLHAGTDGEERAGTVTGAPCHRAAAALLRSGTAPEEVDALCLLAGLGPVSADVARSGALLARHLTVAHGLPEARVAEQCQDVPGALGWHDLLHEARAAVAVPHRHDEPGEPGAPLYQVEGGLRVACMGNSIAANGNGEVGGDSGLSFLGWASELSGGGIRHAGSFSVGGASSSQILASQLGPVIASRPDACVIGPWAVNNPVLGVSFERTAADVGHAVEALRSAGITPLLSLEPPAGDPERSAFVRQYNEWARRYAARAGVPVADFFTPLSNGGGAWADGYNLGGDGLHPNSDGARVMGRVIAGLLSSRKTAMQFTADGANGPWGSDNTVSHPPQKPYGATSPIDKDMDPASYGPLAGPDPENWGRIDAGDVFQMPIGNTAAVRPMPGDLHWPDQSQDEQGTFSYQDRAATAGPSTAMTPRDPNGIRMEEALNVRPGDESASRADLEAHVGSDHPSFFAGDVYQPTRMDAGDLRGLHWRAHQLEDEEAEGSGRYRPRNGPIDPVFGSIGELHDEPEAALPSTTGDDLEATAAADGTIGGGNAGTGDGQAPADVAGLGEFGAAHRTENRQPADHPGCAGAQTVWLTRSSEPRCSGCGHRVIDPESGHVPEQTRDMGPAQWVKEIPSREMAKRATPMGDQSVAEGLSGGAQEPSMTGQQPGMGSMDEPLMPDDQSIQTIGGQQWSGGGADSDETAVEPGQPQGGIDDIVASFQRSAASRSYAGDGSAAAGAGDIAGAARAYLAKTAEVLPQAEADELIREGRGQRARNLGLLNLEGTHYEDEDSELERKGLSVDDHEDDVIFA
jgi:lysophospholipase L1-like esterase